MPGETPPYPPSDRTNSTCDDMTLTDNTNPRGSVAASTAPSESHDTIKPTPAFSNPKSVNIEQNATELEATTSTEKPLTSPTVPSNDATAQEEPEPAPHIADRKSSILHAPLPPLPFHLREHKGAISFVVIVMLIDHGIFPPACYFGLHYATDIDLTTIFAIITSIFGVVLGLECLIRSIKLILPNPKFRPLGQTARFGMDFWQYSFTLCLILNVICVSVGTALEPPFLNLMAMPMPLVIFNLSWQLLLFDFLHERKVRTPFRISSTPKGEIWPRFIYVIIEDVIAVDCNGKREWRQAWKSRVEASKPMRDTLKRLSMFWGIGGIVVSSICFGLLWGFDSVSGKEAGYALGWLLPWAWIIPSTIFTTFYVKHRLRDERHFCQRYKGSFSV